MAVGQAVGGGYCRLQTPLNLALAVRGTVAGHRLGALESGGGGAPPLPLHPAPPMRSNVVLGRACCATLEAAPSRLPTHTSARGIRTGAPRIGAINRGQQPFTRPKCGLARARCRGDSPRPPHPPRCTRRTEGGTRGICRTAGQARVQAQTRHSAAAEHCRPDHRRALWRKPNVVSRSTQGLASRHLPHGGPRHRDCAARVCSISAVPGPWHSFRCVAGLS